MKISAKKNNLNILQFFESDFFNYKIKDKFAERKIKFEFSWLKMSTPDVVVNFV